jgi:nucleotide-binding universal stress UspA family protein
MKRIMVGLDGSASSTAAVRWSAALAAATDAQLVGVHAFRHPYAEVPVSEHERMLAERAEIIDQQWLRPAIEAGARVRSQIVEGDPRRILPDTAREGNVDLLVLGRTGQGVGPGFLHLGSVVEHLAHDARRPLAVIPSDAAQVTRQIVLGLDGSPAAEAATEWCRETATAFGAHVVAVTVQEPILEWTPSWDEHNWRRNAEHDLADWTSTLTRAGVDVELAPTENLYPVDGLLAVVAERSADLLVVGTRGTGGFFGLRFGGVAMKALHRSTIPLVMVPPSA